MNRNTSMRDTFESNHEPGKRPAKPANPRNPFERRGVRRPRAQRQSSVTWRLPDHEHVRQASGEPEPSCWVLEDILTDPGKADKQGNESPDQQGRGSQPK